MMGLPMTTPRWAVPLVLAVAVVACFCPALQGEFVNWDDDANLTENEAYRGLSPAHLGWMFTTTHMGNYQPLTWLSFGVDYVIWEMNAGGYHFTNLALHLASTLLFYYFLLLLLDRVMPERPPARWPAAIAALFFGIHPLRVESVAWATERKGVLCVLFLMLSLVAYLRMDREERQGRSGGRWLALSAVMFTASLFSKILGILLPVALLAIDVYPLRRFVPGRRHKVLLEKIPYFAASLLAGLATIHAVESAGVARAAQDVHPIARIEEAAFGLCFYLYKSVLPFALSPLYPASRPETFNPLALPLLVSVGIAAALFSSAIVLRRRYPAATTAFFCYAVLLVPVLRLNFDAPQLVADRYAYIACLPWAVLLAFLMAKSRRSMRTAAAVVLLSFGALSFVQTKVWHDSISLWTQALKVDASNTFAYNNRGTARAMSGDRAGAIEDFTRALQRDPNYSDAWYNRGKMRADATDLDGAIADHSEAIRLTPSFARAWKGRGEARRAKGDTEGARGDLAEAARLGATDTSRIHATTGSAEVKKLVNDGIALASKGNLDGAIAQFSKALAIDPKIAALYYNRATARTAKGDQAGAAEDYSEALKLNPDYRDAYADRGMARAKLGDFRGAADDYSQALRLQPRDPEVLVSRGVVRAKLGDRPGAADDFQTALTLAPADWKQRPTVQTLLARVRGR
jgi:tetratricopeptide (TPR) repeat protein